MPRQLLPIESGKVLADPGDTGREFVIRSRKTQFLLQRRRAFEVMPQRRHGLLLCGPTCVKHGDVRSVDFVPAKGVEICAQGADVDRAVRRVGYGVDAEETAWDGVD